MGQKVVIGDLSPDTKALPHRAKMPDYYLGHDG